MQEVSWGTSGGYFIKIISENDYSYFYSLRDRGIDPVQGDVAFLGLGALSISKFKEKYKILSIIELTYSPCGHHVFTIQDDRFVEHSGEYDVE